MTDVLDDLDEVVARARAGNRALTFLQTLAMNLDNTGLPDDQFRNFVRNSLESMPGVEYTKPDRQRPPEGKL